MKGLLWLLWSGFKWLKLGKVFVTSGSMLVAVVAYAWLYGWRYAVGLVALIFCHEMGHFLAARQRGLNVGAPVFIPFVGAWIELKEQPRDAETEAYVGVAGPVVGTLAALACYAFARYEDSEWLLALSYSGFFLNLFNLVPVPPLDGGRVTGVISRKIWWLGLPVLIGVFLWRPSPLLVMIALMALPSLWQSFKQDGDSVSDYYGTVSTEKRAEYALLYLGLLAFLSVMCHDLYQMLSARH